MSTGRVSLYVPKYVAEGRGDISPLHAMDHRLLTDAQLLEQGTTRYDQAMLRHITNLRGLNYRVRDCAVQTIVSMRLREAAGEAKLTLDKWCEKINRAEAAVRPRPRKKRKRI